MWWILLIALCELSFNLYFGLPLLLLCLRTYIHQMLSLSLFTGDRRTRMNFGRQMNITHIQHITISWEKTKWEPMKLAKTEFLEFFNFLGKDVWVISSILKIRTSQKESIIKNLHFRRLNIVRPVDWVINRLITQTDGHGFINIKQHRSFVAAHYTYHQFLRRGFNKCVVIIYCYINAISTSDWIVPYLLVFFQYSKLYSH